MDRSWPCPAANSPLTVLTAAAKTTCAAFCNQCGVRLRESQTLRDDEGRAKLYADIAHPINSACREMIQERVIAAFGEERARSRLPGYVPSYDDFDIEDQIMEAGEPGAASDGEASLATLPIQPNQILPSHVQPAEKPRGPHRAPFARLACRRPADTRVRRGIFE